MLDSDAQKRLDQWVVDNSLILQHIYLLTYDSSIVAVHLYEVDPETGRFMLDERKRTAVVAPTREVSCDHCPWE